MFNLDSILGLHANSLSLRAERANIIANNLANADTPGYKARDFDFNDALDQALGQQKLAGIKKTNPAHLGQDSLASLNNLQYRIPLQPSLDGNTVDKQIETAEFSKNALQYQTSFNFLNGQIKSLLTAIRGE